VKITPHILVRSQQRAFSMAEVDIILSYATPRRTRDGGESYCFDHASWARYTRDSGMVGTRNSRLRKLVVIIKEGVMLTGFWRRRRHRRDCISWKLRRHLHARSNRTRSWRR
jgi:hypothetical protein